MPIGSSSLYTVKQNTPRNSLVLDQSYFRIRLHEEQLFFPANWFQQADHAIVSTAVDSTFQPGQVAQSLYKATVVAKNTPVQIGVSANLTDWLPARSNDSVRVSLKYLMYQGAPLNNLIKGLEKIGLTSELSLVSPEWAVAVKVSQIAGRLIDYLAGAGDVQELLALTFDFNVSSLQTGYYAVVGSRTDEFWPLRLQMDASQRLSDPEGNSLLRLSYAVAEVLSLPRRGVEKVRDEAWWEVLQAGKDQVLASINNGKRARDKAWGEWQAVLLRVRALSRKSRALLQCEIDDLIRTAHIEVQQALLPGPTQESTAPLPSEWQKLLGVQNERELYDTVRDYQDALNIAQHLLAEYSSY